MRSLLALVALAFASCTAPSSPGEGEGEGEGGREAALGLAPNRMLCQCHDSSNADICVSDDDCAQGTSAICDNICATHNGVLSLSCYPQDTACLFAPKNDGENAVLCRCPDKRDDGVCTSLDCSSDADTIAAQCAQYCPASTDAPVCVASTSCAAGGPPPGRDLAKCDCIDGSWSLTCTAGICGDDARYPQLCDSQCATHGGRRVEQEQCALEDPSCAFADDQGVRGGPNAVTCACGAVLTLAACTALSCTDDADAIDAGCADLCSNTGSPPPSPVSASCVADNSCAAGGPPRGSTLSFCQCLDDSAQAIFCGVATLDCDATCASHGGIAHVLPEGGTSQSLFCLAGGGGPNSIACDCVEGPTSVVDETCGTVDCADGVALSALCDVACLGNGQAASPSCVVDDPNCAPLPVTAGPFVSDCGCRDGAHVTTCVSDCGNPQLVTNACFPACQDHGGFGSFTCAEDTTTCPP